MLTKTGAGNRGKEQRMAKSRKKTRNNKAIIAILVVAIAVIAAFLVWGIGSNWGKVEDFKDYFNGWGSQTNEPENPDEPESNARVSVQSFRSAASSRKTVSLFRFEPWLTDYGSYDFENDYGTEIIEFTSPDTLILVINNDWDNPVTIPCKMYAYYKDYYTYLFVCLDENDETIPLWENVMAGHNGEEFTGTNKLEPYLYCLSWGSSSSLSLDSPEIKITCDMEVLELPAEPVKEGHTFVGWYLDEALTIPYDGGKITSDMTFYAKFEINKYKVTFDSTGGSAVSPVTVNWNTPASLTTPTKAGHNFTGWYLANGTRYTNQPIKSDTALTARWEIKTFTVTFDGNGITSPAAQTLNWNTTVTLPEVTREGYTFTGWYLDNDTEYENQPVTSNLTLTAHWEIKTFTVAFIGSGAANPATQTVDWNTAVTLPHVSREGYNFLGWYLTNGTKYENQPIKTNTTLTAQWQIITFTVTFIVDGEVYKTMQVDYGTSLIAVAEKVNKDNLELISVFSETGALIENLSDRQVKENYSIEVREMQGKEKFLNILKNNAWYIAGGVAGVAVVCCIIGLIVSKKKTA